MRDGERERYIEQERGTLRETEIETERDNEKSNNVLENSISGYVP